MTQYLFQFFANRGRSMADGDSSVRLRVRNWCDRRLQLGCPREWGLLGGVLLLIRRLQHVPHHQVGWQFKHLVTWCCLNNVSLFFEKCPICGCGIGFKSVTWSCVTPNKEPYILLTLFGSNPCFKLWISNIWSINNVCQWFVWHNRVASCSRSNRISVINGTYNPKKAENLKTILLKKDNTLQENISFSYFQTV